MIWLWVVRGVAFELAFTRALRVLPGHYQYSTISIDAQNSSLIIGSLNLSFLYRNANPNDRSPLDLFFGLSSDDFACYREAIATASYLRPCDFLFDELKTRLDNTTVAASFTLRDYRQLAGLTATAVIDNTLFPSYPEPGDYLNYPVMAEATTAVLVHGNSFYRWAATIEIAVLGTAGLVLLAVNLVLAGLLYRTKARINQHRSDSLPFRYSSSS